MIGGWGFRRKKSTPHVAACIRGEHASQSLPSSENARDEGRRARVAPMQGVRAYV
jgi:hypothetical protein